MELAGSWGRLSEVDVELSWVFPGRCWTCTSLVGWGRVSYDVTRDIGAAAGMLLQSAELETGGGWDWLCCGCGCWRVWLLTTGALL